MGRARRRGAVRGTALAVLSAELTAVGHVAGGGALPDAAVLVVLLPLLAAVLVAIAEACTGALATVAALATGQAVLHEVMVLLHPTHTSGAGLDTPSMLTMHAAVTVVTALALTFADRAVSALVGALARVLPRRITPLPARRPLRACPVPDAGVPVRLALALATTALRRGPPVGC